MVNKLYLKQLQTNQREKRANCRKSKIEVHWIKPQIQDHSKSQLAKTSKDQQISQYLQMCGYFVPSKLTTSNKLACSKHWKSVSPNNSSMQKEEKQLSSASPTESQTWKKLHSIKHEQQTYSGANFTTFLSIPNICLKPITFDIVASPSLLIINIFCLMHQL